ncbi:cytosolic protein [Psychrobacillus psychrodurans]|uniref:cytosolic protein n=1 Tax=Psychrobacillus psychrodurans TaxID=126157 RepID=UPI003D07E4A8
MYESSSLPPKYIIGEAKYGRSQLSKTKTGKQMSDEWVDSKNRLDNALGREKADEIRMELLLNPENIESVLVKVGKDGEVSQLILDEFGKKKK